jgi:hypothetical protein
MLSQKRHRQDEQRAAHHSRGHEEPHRVFEVDRQDVVLALALGLEPFGQAHEAREGHLDQGEKQQPGCRDEHEECVESCHEGLMPGNQARRQTRALPKLVFEAAHLSTVGLVIVAQEVQEAVQRQNSQLGLQRVAQLTGLTGCNSPRDGKIAKKRTIRAGSPGVWQKGQHVGRHVLASELLVKPAHRRIGHDGDGEVSFGSSWCVAAEPAAQRRSTLDLTAARVGDCHDDPGCGSTAPRPRVHGVDLPRSE